MGIYYQFVNKSPTGFAMGNHISVVINYQFINKYIAHRSGDTQTVVGRPFSPITVGIRRSSIYRPSHWGYAGRQYSAQHNIFDQSPIPVGIHMYVHACRPYIYMSPITVGIRKSSIYYHPSPWGYIRSSYIAHHRSWG